MVVFSNRGLKPFTASYTASEVATASKSEVRDRLIPLAYRSEVITLDGQIIDLDEFARFAYIQLAKIGRYDVAEQLIPMMGNLEPV